ncbi:RPEL repeat protein-like protein [Pleomassaria siparia CBS 279.74]|uniref:RPEL repeat protein-like protein n=1 Tax=Pleomassaria siparia CBS 279.74 TaxID=1314801 RepID=A0A6G1JTE8_9PLEO|nr:RPEL repeat protein-like protein [Pleomassaria siparia CBS 279.74]
MSAEPSTTPVVDETPISPIRQAVERRNSLEKHLQHRPEAQDLKNRHILLDTTTAPALQAKALELERQRATDNLKKGLTQRPDRDTLVERNILPDSAAAPALLQNQRELERHMRADSLDKGLQGRPSPEELVKKGILTEDENPLKE